MTADLHRIVFDYGGCRIAVASHERLGLDWLIEFLTPQFSLVDAHDADHEVCLRSDPAEHARLQSRMLAHSCVEMEVFSFDGYLSLMPAWIEHGVRWLCEAKQALFYGIDDHARTVHLVAAESQSRYRHVLMRVVRELASVARLQAGHLPIHAAAFETGGGGVLLCGPKYSGKTTLLIHALQGGARFISNDRVFVDGAAIVRGMPTIVSLRSGTLELHAELRRKLLASCYRSRLTMAEAAALRASAGDAAPAPGSGSLNACQLCQLLDVEMIGAAPLAMIVFPRVCTDVQGLQFRPLGDEDACARLRQGLMQTGAVPRLSEAFAPAGVNRLLDVAAQERACRDLVRKIACYECLLGNGAYARDISWRQRLAG
jgi:hypothetical protein